MLSSVSSFFNSLVTSNRHADGESNGSVRKTRAPPKYMDSESQRSSGEVPPTRIATIPTTKRPAPLALAHQGSPSSVSNMKVGSPSSIMSSASQGPAIGYYSPGARSSFTQSRSSVLVNNTIQLQEFAADGSPLPPSVIKSWARIDAWAEEYYPELYDQLTAPATSSDIDELENDLGCELPLDVRESLQVHDGQERGGRPTGIILGVALLDCEEIVEEWRLWKQVASRSSSQGETIKALTSTSSKLSRSAILAGQHSKPPGAIQAVYAHAAWIPMAKDFGGNNIAIDLSPGPAGHWGQVILFGHNMDTKYVVARSWSHFLAIVASDLERRNAWTINEESGELSMGRSYFDVLRVRVDQLLHKRNSSVTVSSRRSSMTDMPAGSLPGSSRRSSKASPLIPASATFSSVTLPRTAAVRSTSSYTSSPNVSTVSLPEAIPASPGRTVSSSSTTRLLTSASLSTLVPKDSSTSIVLEEEDSEQV